MQKRAKAGGEVGKNGFWYDGGQFLPETMLGKMSKRSAKELKAYTSRKQEIEPFVWELPKNIGVRALWDLCNVAISVDGKNYAMISQERIDRLCSGMGWGECQGEILKKWATLWLSGERWISQDEAPFFWWADAKKYSSSDA